MTEERNTPESTRDQDALVTETYRDMADERTPAHLDQVVLRRAGRAVRPNYSRLTTWTRPMAWAATVMLTVTLVLQITEVPAPQAPVFEARPTKNERNADEFKLKDMELLRQAEDMARVQLGESNRPEPSQVASGLSKAIPDCDATAIATPDTWLECIVEFEQAGLTDVAREQRQLLGEAFPDFEFP